MIIGTDFRDSFFDAQTSFRRVSSSCSCAARFLVDTAPDREWSRAAFKIPSASFDSPWRRRGPHTGTHFARSSLLVVGVVGLRPQTAARGLQHQTGNWEERCSVAIGCSHPFWKAAPIGDRHLCNLGGYDPRKCEETECKIRWRLQWSWDLSKAIRAAQQRLLQARARLDLKNELQIKQLQYILHLNFQNQQPLFCAGDWTKSSWESQMVMFFTESHKISHVPVFLPRGRGIYIQRGGREVAKSGHADWRSPVLGWSTKCFWARRTTYFAHLAK